MKSCITAIGTAVPANRIAQSDIYRFMADAHALDEQDAKKLHNIYRHSGIEHRHSVLKDFGNGSRTFFSNAPDLEPFPTTADRLRLYEDIACSLGAEATKACFAKVPEMHPAEISHLITVSCTGMHAPGVDIELVECLGLNKDVERTCINFMGCYGAFNALKTADYICRAEPAAIVLIVGIELCTLHFQKHSSLDNWLANSLFSDGAAAVIVRHKDSCAPGRKSLSMEQFHTELIPEARDEMAWHIGDFGFRMRLSPHIAKNLRKVINDVVGRLLQKAALERNSISRYAIHPGGRRILEVCEEALGCPEEANKYAYEVLRNFGNMSSATVLFVLERLMKDLQEEDKHTNVLSMAFGPGLTVESMILQVN
jgi:predicted naringenin-chalcone synthase